MLFYYDENAGNEQIIIKELSHFKARRQKINDIVNISKLDGFLYSYKIINFEKRQIILQLLSKKDFVNNNAFTHLALAMIELDSLYEILPYLNELGLSKLYLVYCDYSQKNIKFDEKQQNKAKRILINSSMQCARADILEIEVFKDLKSLKDAKGELCLIDFSANKLCEFDNKKLYVIGPEGGFSKKELSEYKLKALNTKLILKAKNAALYLNSNIQSRL